ncbi:Uncharacterised protein [Ewingella americana]|nr:Uncharacterised protein [Ewingella americana]
MLHPDGVGLIKGAECKDYSQIKHKILFVKKNKSYEFNLGKNLNSDLSYQFFETTFCDYSAARITSIGQRGIDISLMEDGDYIIKCEIACAGISLIKDMTSKKEINTQSNFQDKIASIYNLSDKIYLSINSLNRPILHKIFEIKNKWIKDNKLHYEGIFALKGVDIKDWGDATYYLYLISNDASYLEKIGLSNKDELKTVFPDHYGNYQKAYFCSIG